MGIIRTVSIAAILAAMAIGCNKDDTADALSYTNYSDAHSNGLDTLLLQNLISKIEQGDYGNVHSLLISKNDELVMEEYFEGYTREKLHRIYSATKSVTSALIGIAIDNGEIDGTAEKLMPIFPEYGEIGNWDDQKNDISLEHVLNMSAGYEWDERTYAYEDKRNPVAALWASDDMIKHMLDLPLSHSPGAQFNYNSGGAILLSGIIDNKTGLSAEDYAEKNLFSKIGITNWEWWSGDDGLTWTSGELHLRPIDMIKFGELYIKQGRWEQHQVLSEHWVETSTEKSIKVNNQYDYAYQWWKYATDHIVNSMVTENDIYFAWGYGGQFIWVVPHLNMVIATTAGNYDNKISKSQPMFWQDLLPAVK